MGPTQVSERIHDGNVGNPNVNVFPDGTVGRKEHEGVAGGSLVQKVQHVLGSVCQPDRQQWFGFHEMVVRDLQGGLVGGTHAPDFFLVDSIGPLASRLALRKVIFRPKVSQKGSEFTLDLPPGPVLCDPFPQGHIKGLQVDGIVSVQLGLVDFVFVVVVHFVVVVVIPAFRSLFSFVPVVGVSVASEHAPAGPAGIGVFFRLHGVQGRPVNSGVAAPPASPQTQPTVALTELGFNLAAGIGIQFVVVSIVDSLPSVVIECIDALVISLGFVQQVFPVVFFLVVVLVVVRVVHSHAPIVIVVPIDLVVDFVSVAVAVAIVVVITIAEAIVVFLEGLEFFRLQIGQFLSQSLLSALALAFRVQGLHSLAAAGGRIFVFVVISSERSTRRGPSFRLFALVFRCKDAAALVGRRTGGRVVAVVFETTHCDSLFVWLFVWLFVRLFLRSFSYRILINVVWFR
mmetsp:Transcript_21970/g.61099  ORF Transcript_21970/g.61099 Transcript_21970/m.61099 type:complete len:457 (-) Transcript_21970:164-1534(-)